MKNSFFQDIFAATVCMWFVTAFIVYPNFAAPVFYGRGLYVFTLIATACFFIRGEGIKVFVLCLLLSLTPGIEVIWSYIDGLTQEQIINPHVKKLPFNFIGRVSYFIFGIIIPVTILIIFSVKHFHFLKTHRRTA